MTLRRVPLRLDRQERAVSSLICPNCQGAVADATDLFCQACGHRLADRQPVENPPKAPVRPAPRRDPGAFQWTILETPTTAGGYSVAAGQPVGVSARGVRLWLVESVPGRFELTESVAGRRPDGLRLGDVSFVEGRAVVVWQHVAAGVRREADVSLIAGSRNQLVVSRLGLRQWGSDRSDCRVPDDEFSCQEDPRLVRTIQWTRGSVPVPRGELASADTRTAGAARVPTHEETALMDDVLSDVHAFLVSLPDPTWAGYAMAHDRTRAAEARIVCIL